MALSGFALSHSRIGPIVTPNRPMVPRSSVAVMLGVLGALTVTPVGAHPGSPLHQGVRQVAVPTTSGAPVDGPTDQRGDAPERVAFAGLEWDTIGSGTLTLVNDRLRVASDDNGAPRSNDASKARWFGARTEVGATDEFSMRVDFDPADVTLATRMAWEAWHGDASSSTSLGRLEARARDAGFALEPRFNVLSSATYGLAIDFEGRTVDVLSGLSGNVVTARLTPPIQISATHARSFRIEKLNPTAVWITLDGETRAVSADAITFFAEPDTNPISIGNFDISSEGLGAFTIATPSARFRSLPIHVSGPVLTRLGAELVLDHPTPEQQALLEIPLDLASGFGTTLPLHTVPDGGEVTLTAWGILRRDTKPVATIHALSARKKAPGETIMAFDLAGVGDLALDIVDASGQVLLTWPFGATSVAQFASGPCQIDFDRLPDAAHVEINVTFAEDRDVHLEPMGPHAIGRQLRIRPRSPSTWPIGALTHATIATRNVPNVAITDIRQRHHAAPVANTASNVELSIFTCEGARPHQTWAFFLCIDNTRSSAPFRFDVQSLPPSQFAVLHHLPEGAGKGPGNRINWPSRVAPPDGRCAVGVEGKAPSAYIAQPLSGTISTATPQSTHHLYVTETVLPHFRMPKRPSPCAVDICGRPTSELVLCGEEDDDETFGANHRSTADPTIKRPRTQPSPTKGPLKRNPFDEAASSIISSQPHPRIW